jgi:hypothetical protein
MLTVMVLIIVIMVEWNAIGSHDDDGRQRRFFGVRVVIFGEFNRTSFVTCDISL